MGRRRNDRKENMEGRKQARRKWEEDSRREKKIGGGGHERDESRSKRDRSEK